GAFFASTKRDADTGCLIWAGQQRKGYGVTSLGGRSRLAHRVAYELKHRVTLKPSDHSHHVCRNTTCVEPAHLLVVPATGELGHNAVHRLENQFIAGVEAGDLERELVDVDSERWPQWLDARALGSLRPSEVEA